MYHNSSVCCSLIIHCFVVRLLLAKYPKAVKRLQAGRTIREVAGECKLSTKTVQNIKNALKNE